VNAQPETRYARNGPIDLAYQVLGSGPPNLLVVQAGPNSHVDHNWMEPSLARFIRRLASFSRLILYDNRGVGLSDPVPGSAAPTMDEQVDDIRAILDETGCRRAVLMGNWAGCAPALVFAAAHPERVESLILMGGYARLRRDGARPRRRDPGHRGAHRGPRRRAGRPGRGPGLPHHPRPAGGLPHPVGKPRQPRAQESRGSHELKGVPGRWEVFAVV
jgi:pimeloyl-ACP methyl ester carboxylesterase